MQQTLKQLNIDIGDCGKHYQTLEQTFLLSQNSNINTSVDRNFKNINSGIAQLRQTIKVHSILYRIAKQRLQGISRLETKNLRRKKQLF